MSKNVKHPSGIFLCCVLLNQPAKQGPPGVISLGPASMPKSVGILNDEEDKNKERDEAKLKLLVCMANLLWLNVLPLYNEKSCRVILDLLSILFLIRLDVMCVRI